MRMVLLLMSGLLLAGCATATAPPPAVAKAQAVTEESIMGQWCGMDSAGLVAYALEFSPNKRGKLAIAEGDGPAVTYTLAWDLSGRRVTCAARPAAEVSVDAFGPIMTLRVRPGAEGQERVVDLYRAGQVLPRLQRALNGLAQ